MKIGVFGGTFNPIHKSHIYLSEQFRDKLGLERVVLAPAYTPPHKMTKGLASAEDRLEMCRLATRDLPLFHITEYEIREQGKSYTYRTLRHVAEKYPGSELYLMMGGDMFLTVQDWRRSADLFEMATICTAQRQKGELTALHMHKDLLEMQGARCELLELEARPMSSTEVRERIRKKEDPSEFLHPDVWAYIQKHGLYGAGR